MEMHELRPKDSGKALRVLKLSRSSFHYRSLKDDSTVMMELEQLTQVSGSTITGCATVAKKSIISGYTGFIRK
ncbi:hypothetical protein EIH07_05375 [Chryseobacterium taklimakanense]|uniref:hypothetical protein n=1 Tax=Chryseobacterium taklimakanense TaxID=536441 RepID=UPI000F5E133B|nr:hypothetical protein [Chryseobacterium taklimakanense]AZI22514.1 hypothetical protein EIH07_05375 [Chryseobacterium taklimakanense]